MYKRQDISIPVGTLQSIEVTAQPAKTSYYVGEKFDASGMKVTATYKGSEGNFTKEISNYSFAKEAFATSGKQKDVYKRQERSLYRHSAL